jgi:hypothetical protein
MYNIVKWLTIDGFGLVIEFIEPLQTVTSTCKYWASANSHTLQFTRARKNSYQPSVLHRLSSGNDFHRRRFLSFRVHVLTSRLLSHSYLNCVVATRSCRTDRVEKTASKLLHCSMLRNCCLATACFAEPLPISGSLLPSQFLSWATMPRYLELIWFWASSVIRYS